MKAITVEPKKQGTARLEDVPEPDARDGSVLDATHPITGLLWSLASRGALTVDCARKRLFGAAGVVNESSVNSKVIMYQGERTAFALKLGTESFSNLRNARKRRHFVQQCHTSRQYSAGRPIQCHGWNRVMLFGIGTSAVSIRILRRAN
jgi:hypothetical protein